MRGSRTGGWLMVALLTAQTSAALASPATGKAASKRASATAVHAATAAASDDESDKLYVSEPKPVRSVLHDPEILSRDEMLALARKYGADLSQSLLDGEQQREVAVRERDTLKLACIQDHLLNMKLMKIMANDSLAALDRPSIRADELSLRHEFRGVELASNRVAELHRELSECVGESLTVTAGGQPEAAGNGSATGSTAVTDPAGNDIHMPTIERPIAASPTN